MSNHHCCCYTQGVTIPSQRRYVTYMSDLVGKMSKQLVPRTLLCTKIRMHSFPKISNCHPFFKIYVKKTCVYESRPLVCDCHGRCLWQPVLYHSKKPPPKSERNNVFEYDVPALPICGDITIQFLDLKTMSSVCILCTVW